MIDDLISDRHWYFDLQRDPGEQHPIESFDGELGQKAEAGYLGEVDGLNAFIDRHPAPAALQASATAPKLSPEFQKKLQELGYLGDEPAGRSKEKDQPRGDEPPVPPKDKR